MEVIDRMLNLESVKKEVFDDVEETLRREFISTLSSKTCAIRTKRLPNYKRHGSEHRIQADEYAGRKRQMHRR